MTKRGTCHHQTRDQNVLNVLVRSRLFTVPYFFVRSFRYTASYRHGYLDFQMYRGGRRRGNRKGGLLLRVLQNPFSIKLFVCRNKNSILLTKDNYKSQKDVFGAHIVFLFSREERSCSSSSSPKSQWFATLT